MNKIDRFWWIYSALGLIIAVFGMFRPEFQIPISNAVLFGLLMAVHGTAMKKG